MDEIEIIRGGPTIWPWMLGLLTLALIVWAVGEFYGGPASEPRDPVPAQADTVGVVDLSPPALAVS